MQKKPHTKINKNQRRVKKEEVNHIEIDLWQRFPKHTMKMLPVQLQLNPPLSLLNDVWWRHPQAMPSPLVELKTQLPPQLPSDPRLWTRDDVCVFLRFCEREFDLPKFEYDLFQMNGKALCLLTRQDLGDRCPGAGDVLHNVLQMLMRESQMLHRHLPNSPVTPTSRYPLSPHSHPPTPTWSQLVPPDSPFHNAHMHQFMPPNSVTLSPAPSIDSQTSSPPQNQEQNGNASNGATGSNGMLSNGNGYNNGSSHQNNNHHHHHANSASSNHSDSDDDQYSAETKSKAATAAAVVANLANLAAAHHHHYSNHQSPPTTPILKDMKVSLSQQVSNNLNLINTWSQQQQQHQQQQQQQQNSQKMNGNNGLTIPNSGGSINSGSVSAPTTPNAFMPSVKREFFPENGEPNTSE